MCKACVERLALINTLVEAVTISPRAPLECSACSSVLRHNSTPAAVKTSCEHVCCKPCFETSMMKHSTCPVCSTQLLPKGGEVMIAPEGASQRIDESVERGEAESFEVEPMAQEKLIEIIDQLRAQGYPVLVVRK